MANISRSRKSGFTLRAGVMRRETLWFNGVFLITDLPAGTAVLLASLNAAALALRPFTVVRTRGKLGIVSDQQAATEDQVLAYGHAVVSEQASAIGVTAVPTPVTDNASDLWFVFEVLFARLLFGTQASFTSTIQEQSIDSKAMRKVEDGEDLVEMAETTAASEGLRLYSFSRILIKLH